MATLITTSISSELLKDVDELAHQKRVSRSKFIAIATRRLVNHVKKTSVNDQEDTT